MWTESQRRYQNSPKGKAARARYMEKRKARLQALKNAQTDKTNDPQSAQELTKAVEEGSSKK